jgi:hypothetical protein
VVVLKNSLKQLQEFVRTIPEKLLANMRFDVISSIMARGRWATSSQGDGINDRF